MDGSSCVGSVSSDMAREITQPGLHISPIISLFLLVFLSLPLT